MTDGSPHPIPTTDGIDDASSVDDAGDTDPRLLRLGPVDNVLLATTTVPAGEELVIDGVQTRTDQEIRTGFKVAGVDLDLGDAVIRLGTPIGEMTQAAARGALVHLHNLTSRYLRTHRRGEM